MSISADQELPPGERKQTGDAITVSDLHSMVELDAFKNLLHELRDLKDQWWDMKTFDHQWFLGGLNKFVSSITPELGYEWGFFAIDEEWCIVVNDEALRLLSDYSNMYNVWLADSFGYLDSIVNEYNALIAEEDTVCAICDIQEKLLELDIDTFHKA